MLMFKSKSEKRIEQKDITIRSTKVSLLNLTLCSVQEVVLTQLKPFTSFNILFEKNRQRGKLHKKNVLFRVRSSQMGVYFSWSHRRQKEDTTKGMNRGIKKMGRKIHFSVSFFAYLSLSRSCCDT